MSARPPGYYWLRLGDKWHIACWSVRDYWCLSYEFSSPLEGIWTEEQVLEENGVVECVEIPQPGKIRKKNSS